jgi:NAD-reducing hydrogenase small subunit
MTPRLFERVRRLHDVVPVDYFLPGCPPSASAIYEFVAGLLSGAAPAEHISRFGA